MTEVRIASKKIFTLVLLHIEAQKKILLGFKKRGFGADRYNGFGGKVEAGETIEAAAYRELEEEAGITTDVLEKVGLLWFTFRGDTKGLEVHVFRAASYNGVPMESEEMKPQWFPTSEIPFSQMWADDHHWFPLFLSGKKFVGKFHFLEDQVTITGKVLDVVDELPEGFDIGIDSC
ncbi:7,8-dihydro-8-oxoguanine triphosphatase-like protein [Jimgerdemannia flammicorona]|uniref:Oxidized purine nucleoside triphosphate hydrolase n=2 Tax=Jimgerdemannia flammicorona TaxID=994334 RepID=A0A433B9Q3_9FUNG|nr:7,8-dihydro-8-oxoguanine triphosphatase-like protein [Jimgerdemannia flammicorona]RUS28788.1 7,8-dihydro-8-oxoguanine triphosphatase-like protein [Jimgerdemannia flammicorona]